MAWYRSLKQPDTGISCCGFADAYWADEVHVEGDKIIAVITDDQDDVPLMRRHIPIGTRFEIPVNKLNRDPNLSGHVIVFVNSADQVLCFITNGGV